jgi:hypothetical protein
MAIRSYPRATEPHFHSLAAALKPVLLQWFQHYDKGFVYIEHADFAGITDQAIQAIVDAAPETSPLLDAKQAADQPTLLDRAIADVNRALFNQERVARGVSTITRAEYVALVKNAIDQLTP